MMTTQSLGYIASYSCFRDFPDRRGLSSAKLGNNPGAEALLFLYFFILFLLLLLWAELCSSVTVQSEYVFAQFD